MEENNCVVTLSAREADRKLAVEIDRLMTGETRAVLLTRHGFNVGVVVAPRDAARDVRKLIEKMPAVIRRNGGTKR